MPARDGTGPNGTGPFGRGQGGCRGNEQETGYEHPNAMGMANRWGRRFGNRHSRFGQRGNATNSTANRANQGLQNLQNWLKDQLDAVLREKENRDKPSV